MDRKELINALQPERMIVKPGHKIKLKDLDPAYTGKLTKE